MTWRTVGARHVALLSLGVLAAPATRLAAQATGQAGPPPEVRIEVNAAAVHQVMEGFGATSGSVLFAPGNGAELPPAVRARIADAAYHDVRLGLGAAALGRFEPVNDDLDPQHLNQDALDLSALRGIAAGLAAPARASGADGWFPDVEIGPSTADWLVPMRKTRARYLDEYAEHVVAAVLKWRDATGDIPRYEVLSYEPLDGEPEVRDSGTYELIEIIKRTGARLRSAGMPTKLLVPSDDSATLGGALAREILADPRARQYVGAIGYRVPEGSAYASLARVLERPGTGRREDGALLARRVVRNLGREHNVPVWVMAVPPSDLDPRSMDALRARAIQIHDELSFADAAAVFATLAAPSGAASAGAFGAEPNGLKAGDPIVTIGRDAAAVAITGTGYAMGHYARWVSRGAFRVEASSSDPLVLATAFVDYRRGRASLVIVNNAESARTVRVRLGRLTITGPLTGERSYEGVRWEALGAVAVDGDGKDGFVVVVPGKSVTSVGGGI